jgi:hypothetical protein
LGGRKEVSGFTASGVRVKGEERILGEGDFVMDVLRVSREEMERRYRLKAVGFTLEKLARRVAEIFGMEVEVIGCRANMPGLCPHGVYFVSGR